MKIVGIIEGERPACEALEALSMGADLIEARLDLWPKDRLEDLLAEVRTVARGRLILTCRLPEDGGAWRGGLRDRMSLISRLARRGDLVDLEANRRASMRHARRLLRRGVRVIASRHHFGPFPSHRRLWAWVRSAAWASGVKIAVRVRTARECDALCDFAREAARRIGARASNERLTVIGMGAAGYATRLELPREIGGFVYAPLGRAVAPGQVPLREVVRALR